MKKMADSEVFGKEIGLIHKTVVTGRKVGADKKFWTALADNEEMFMKVVQFVNGQEKPTIDFHVDYYAMIVHCFIDSLETEDVIKRLNEAGKRPVTIEELLYARFEDHEDFKKLNSHVVALGSVLRDHHGNRYVISIKDNSVYFHKFQMIWSNFYTFAALPLVN